MRCEYCNKWIEYDKDNYAGAFEDVCCKQCDNAAEQAMYNNNRMID